MKVKELKEILNNVKNEEMNVVIDGYYTYDVNGYFYDTKNEEEIFILTNRNVQPRV